MSCALFLLGACSSSPQVHVFARYLNDDEKATVGAALEAQEYDVVFNDYEFPASISQNTFVHATLSLSADQHDQLTALLENLGYINVTSQYVGKGKHSFTRNNLGIYLYGSKQVETQDPFVLEMANEYSATMCRSVNFAYLTLTENNQAHLVIHDPTSGNNEETQRHGIWLLDGESVFVSLDNDTFGIEFVRTKIHESTRYGPRVGWKLSPVYGGPVVDFCELEHTRVLREW